MKINELQDISVLNELLRSNCVQFCNTRDYDKITPSNIVYLYNPSVVLESGVLTLRDDFGFIKSYRSTDYDITYNEYSIIITSKDYLVSNMILCLVATDDLNRSICLSKRKLRHELKTYDMSNLDDISDVSYDYIDELLTTLNKLSDEEFINPLKLTILNNLELELSYDSDSIDPIMLYSKIKMTKQEYTIESDSLDKLLHDISYSIDKELGVV